MGTFTEEEVKELMFKAWRLGWIASDGFAYIPTVVKSTRSYDIAEAIKKHKIDRDAVDPSAPPKSNFTES